MEEAIKKAIDDGDLELTRKLAEEAGGKLSKNRRGLSEWFYTIHAAASGKLEIVEYFVKEKGASVASLPIQLYLLCSQAQLKIPPPIIMAIKEGHEDVALFLASRLPMGEDPRKGDQTILKEATEKGMLRLVQSLVLMYGAGDSATASKKYDAGEASEGHSPACHAIFNGHPEIVHFYLGHFGELGKEKKEAFLQKPCHSRYPHDGSIPYFFHIVLMPELYRMPSLTKELIEAGDLDLYRPYTLTLDGGATVLEDVTILHFAAYMGHWLHVHYLVRDLSMSINLLTSKTKRTPLHFACDRKAPMTDDRELNVYMLVADLQADKTLRDVNCESPADLALRRGNKELYDILTFEERTKAADAAADSLLAELDAEATAAAAKQEKKSGGAGSKKKRRNRAAGETGRENESGAQKKEEAVGGEGGGGGGGGIAAAAGGGGGEQLTAAMEDMKLSPAEAKEAAAAFKKGDEKEEKKEAKQEEAPAIPEEEEDPQDFEDFLLDKAPDFLLCPISLCLLRDPVIAEDENTYDRKSLEAWIAQCAAKGQPLTSPKNGLVMGPAFLRSQGIRAQVGEYLERKTKEWEENKKRARKEKK